MPKMTMSGSLARFTKDQREAAAEAIERLQDACDGGHTRDHAGFNREHIESEQVSELYEWAFHQGEIPEEHMTFARSVLRIYSRTQIADLADRIWL